MSSKGQGLYKCTKFGKDISIHGWVITTSGFGKRTAAILKFFYFRFQLWPISRYRYLILLRRTKFHMNRTNGGLVMTLCYFSRWRTSAMYFMYGSDGPPTMCRWWCEFLHQILDWSEVSFRRYRNFSILAIWFENAYSRPFWVGFWGHISPK